MTEEGAENIKSALEAISEQCKATNSCVNCPLFDCCQGDVDLFEFHPGSWFQK